MARKSSPRSATATETPVAPSNETQATETIVTLQHGAKTVDRLPWEVLGIQESSYWANKEQDAKEAAAKSETAAQLETVTIAPETAHSVIAKALPTITNQTELVALLSRLQSFKPEKPVFSSDKATRKGQMIAFKIADKSFRSALGKVYRHAEDLGWGVHADRHAASVTKTGIVTLRRSESLKIAPNGHRFSL